MKCLYHTTPHHPRHPGATTSNPPPATHHRAVPHRLFVVFRVTEIMRTMPWATYAAPAPLLPPQYADVVNTVSTRPPLHSLRGQGHTGRTGQHGFPSSQSWWGLLSPSASGNEASCPVATSLDGPVAAQTRGGGGFCRLRTGVAYVSGHMFQKYPIKSLRALWWQTQWGLVGWLAVLGLSAAQAKGVSDWGGGARWAAQTSRPPAWPRGPG